MYKRQDTWWANLFWKCTGGNKMNMRDFLTVFNGGYGMVLAISPNNWQEYQYHYTDAKKIGIVK